MQDIDRQQQGAISPGLSSRPIQYTVFVRMPGPRNGFVDPPDVQWDAIKDKALWKIISKSSDTSELNWQDISDRFNVSLDFLMQQAAWLYERHFAGVRKQMQRLASTASPIPGSVMRARVPSRLAAPASPIAGDQSSSETARELPATDGAGVLSSRPTDVTDDASTPRPAIPRIPSTTTITQSRLFTSAQTVAQRSAREPQFSSDKSSAVGEIERLQVSERDRRAQSGAQSRRLRQSAFTMRPTLATMTSEGDGDAEQDVDEGEESSSAGELPFATLTNQHADPLTVAPSKAEAELTSSASSSTIPTQSTGTGVHPSTNAHRPDALSPKHRAQLAQLSQRGRKGESSDGTPSMGSSFSDLDDVGISASAMEDAVLQAGGISMASRVSGLSQPFRGNR